VGLGWVGFRLIVGRTLGDSFWGVMLIEVTCVGPGAVRELWLGAGKVST
jgi:hypothetical protein